MAGFFYAKMIFMKNLHRVAFIAIVSVVIIASTGVYGGYRYFFTTKELEETQKSLAYTISTLQDKIYKFQQLEINLSEIKSENLNLSSTLVAEQNKNNLFEGQINAIQGTVNTLEKLSKTDKELLQKYSKVYFLNENYIPSNLSGVDTKYSYNKNELLQIHANVVPFLYRLLDAASSNGMPMEIISAYRSFNVQTALKTSYKIIYGSGANKFSADQGYSEHQLGTTVDLTTPQLGTGFTKFETASVYKWMTDNAYKYGFILSYPKQNAYYQFEPWHWRFIGVSLATKLHESNQYFYNLDQRVIDSYLITIFD